VFYPQRRRPAKGVLEDESIPTLVFTTGCTRKRKPWLATPEVHSALRVAWLRHNSWIVSAYVIMPDHVHFFAEPNQRPIAFDDWITGWKRGLARVLKNSECRWQAGSFHHRIRCFEALLRNESMRTRIRYAPDWCAGCEIGLIVENCTNRAVVVLKWPIGDQGTIEAETAQTRRE